MYSEGAVSEAVRSWLSQRAQPVPGFHCRHSRTFRRTLPRWAGRRLRDCVSGRGRGPGATWRSLPRPPPSHWSQGVGGAAPAPCGARGSGSGEVTSHPSHCAYLIAPIPLRPSRCTHPIPPVPSRPVPPQLVRPGAIAGGSRGKQPCRGRVSGWPRPAGLHGAATSRRHRWGLPCKRLGRQDTLLLG